jgi:hypothetical protein
VNNSTPSLPTFKHISFSSLSSSWNKICVKPHRLERTRRKENYYAKKICKHLLDNAIRVNVKKKNLWLM